MDIVYRGMQATFNRLVFSEMRNVLAVITKVRYNYVRNRSMFEKEKNPFCHTKNQ